MRLAAIDIGGTSIKAALLSPALQVLESFREPTPRGEGGGAVTATVVAVAHRLMRTAIAQCGRRPAALGVASLGIVDEQAGLAVYPAAVGWRAVPPAKLLRAHLNILVFLGHDIRAAGQAEAVMAPGARPPECCLAV